MSRRTGWSQALIRPAPVVPGPGEFLRPGNPGRGLTPWSTPGAGWVKCQPLWGQEQPFPFSSPPGCCLQDSAQPHSQKPPTSVPCTAVCLLCPCKAVPVHLSATAPWVLLCTPTPSSFSPVPRGQRQQERCPSLHSLGGERRTQGPAFCLPGCWFVRVPSLHLLIHLFT